LMSHNEARRRHDECSFASASSQDLTAVQLDARSMHVLECLLLELDVLRSRTGLQSG
jgi:hypothetical protein